VPPISLTFSAVGLPVGASLTDSEFSWTRTGAENGSYDLLFIVTDTELSDSLIVNIIVSVDPLGVETAAMSRPILGTNSPNPFNPTTTVRF
jgi:hypothetical protein